MGYVIREIYRIGGDWGINNLCGKFPPMDWEKYLMIFNHSNFWIEVR